MFLRRRVHSINSTFGPRGVLDKAYNPEKIEPAIARWWKDSGNFEVDTSHPAKNYVICTPPPNITGTLHLGHALGTTLQDVIIRRSRFSGKTLFVPGCDHAGIATQTIVEKHLEKTKGLTRFDLGRENFVGEIQKWKEIKERQIYDQLAKLGCSFDHRFKYFTMDHNLTAAVLESFVRLFEMGLIFRANRFVNWCPSLQSVISDIEVNHLEIERNCYKNVPNYDKKAQFGVLHNFSYPILDSDDKIVVSTTRLETMLGDAAVAVHPEDSRWSKFIGRLVLHPLTHKEIPIIGDISVDLTLGSGALKLTPQHSPVDYDIAESHGIAKNLRIIDKFGNIFNTDTDFDGLNRFEARARLVEVLTDLGLYEGCVDHCYQIPTCSRTGDILEKMMMEQWFMDCREGNARVLESIKSGNPRIVPKFYVNILTEWLTKSPNWCISRQLWWGHQIPAYKISSAGNHRWIVARSQEEAVTKAAQIYPNCPDISIESDQDVLDTWFSAALLPFAIFGWPNSNNLEKYFPQSVLETGGDIVFFWVSRMMLMSLLLLEKMPFDEVVLHGLVCDKKGRKMSKSVGNVIDPVEYIEKSSSRVGADALRLGLCSHEVKVWHVKVDPEIFTACRHFCNKMWQTVRFVNLKLPSDFEVLPIPALTGHESDLDMWLYTKTSQLVRCFDDHMKQRDFHLIVSELRNFWLNDLCGFYLEGIKPRLTQGTTEQAHSVQQCLYRCSQCVLLLLSPFMPFICEWLLFHGGKEPHEPVAYRKWPKTWDFEDNRALGRVETIRSAVQLIRSVKSEFKGTTRFYVNARDPGDLECLKTNIDVIYGLTRVGDVVFGEGCSSVGSVRSQGGLEIGVDHK